MVTINVVKHKHTILLVEDNSLTVKLVRLAMEAEGYELIVCQTGEEAVDYLSREKPNLILQDMRLPDMDGLELVQKLRALPNGIDIPIISFSGFVTMVQEARMVNAGFSDFLVKPVEPALLIQCIQNHLLNIQTINDPRASGRTVLILDDDPLQLKFTVLQFKHAGFSVVHAEDGKEGLILAEQCRPDVIVCDVLMRKMDGFQFCQAIRLTASLRHIPIILLSANYVEEIDNELAAQVGANGYLYRTAGIQNVIDMALDKLDLDVELMPKNTEASLIEVDESIRHRMLQQLERQVSLNVASRQRSMVQHTILGQIGVMADSLFQAKKSGLALDDILARCLDSAGLSQGVFYYGKGDAPLSLRAQFGFTANLDRALQSFGHAPLLIDIMRGEQAVAIPSSSIDNEASRVILTEAGACSALLLPVRGQGGAQGLFAMFSTEELLAEDDWVAFGHNVASQFTQATEISDLFARLTESELRFQQLADNVREAFFVFDLLENKMLYFSSPLERIIDRHLDMSEMHASFLFDFMVPEDQERIRNIATSEHQEYGLEFRIKCSNGKVKWIATHGFPVKNEEGLIYRRCGTVEDITERKEAEQHIERLNRLYALRSGISSSIVRAKDDSELFREACKVAVDVGQFDMAWIGLISYSNNHLDAVANAGTEEDFQALSAARYTAFCSDKGRPTIIHRAIKDHLPHWENTDFDAFGVNGMHLNSYQSVICLPLIAANNVVGVALFYARQRIVFDVTEVKVLTEMTQDISYALDLLKANERYQYLAFNEPLTGLGNRVTLMNRLESAIEKLLGSDDGFALILINLNGFRDINDTLGHRVGDQLLIDIAARLQNLCLSSDSVACLGGDEFAMLASGIANERDVLLASTRIHEAFAEGFQISGVPLHTEARMGIALYPLHSSSAEGLWKLADVALSVASTRSDSVCVYSKECDHFDPQNLALMAEFREALDRDELELSWQPKIDLATKTTCGVEALVRWRHPGRGLLFPDSFIPFVEHTGLIQPLTQWVIARAIAQTAKWRQAGYDLDVAINISARNLLEVGLEQQILTVAEQHCFPVEKIIIEVTESAVMANIKQVALVLGKLRDVGMRIAIDDFGTGQSSLVYLKDLPVTDMKIDKSFVMNIISPGNEAIVKSTIDLAHNLNLSVTAEGVESERALKLLQVMGCDVAQGYFISKPMATVRMVKWLQSSAWPSNSIKAKGED